MLLDFLISGSMLLHSSFIVAGKKEFLKIPALYEIGEYFLSFVQNIWRLVKGLIEKDNSVTTDY